MKLTHEATIACHAICHTRYLAEDALRQAQKAAESAKAAADARSEMHSATAIDWTAQPSEFADEMRSEMERLEAQLTAAANALLEAQKALGQLLN